MKENPLDFSNATFAAYVSQLMREAGTAKAPWWQVVEGFFGVFSDVQWFVGVVIFVLFSIVFVIFSM